MKKIYIHLMMVAAMVVAGAAMVSCSKEEVATGKFKMSINATMAGGNSKALSLNGTTLNATWAEGEEVKVYKGETLLGTLTAQSAGESTTLDGEISGTIAVDDMLVLKFCSPNYASQQGTLEYIAANCDYAEAAVRVVSVDDGVVQIEQGIATFVNQQSIVKFSLVDEGGSTPLNATKLVVNDGTNDYTVTPAAGTSEFWVAIPNIDGQTITLYADIAPCYIYSYVTTTGVTFTTGQYYEITVKMNRYGIDLARMTTGTNATALNGDIITGTLQAKWNSKYFQVSIASGAEVTLRDAVVNPNGSSSLNGYGLICVGNATINLEGQNTLDMSSNYENAGIYVPNGSILTIQGSGSLTVKGGYECSGIGSKKNTDCGTIVINSGTINAYGGGDGAGIGSGYDKDCDGISITGGNVTAFGGGGSGGAAGIGSGSYGKCTGGISITGGTVTSTGAYGSAGIGCGLSAKCGTITITNTVTSVTATAEVPNMSGVYACCIGKGCGNKSSCGTVTVGGTEYSDGINSAGHTYTYTPNN